METVFSFVIRNIHDNGKAGAAVGTVGKWVVVAVLRVHDLVIAVLTGAYIWRNDRHPYGRPSRCA